MSVRFSMLLQIVKKVLRRAPSHTDDNHFGWSQMSCCLERQNCMDKKRSNWRPIKDPNVTMVGAWLSDCFYYSLFVFSLPCELRYINIIYHCGSNGVMLSSNVNDCTQIHAAGMNVPLGNANFLLEQYHYCTLMPGRVEACP